MPVKKASEKETEGKEPEEAGRLTYDSPKTQRWRIGLKLETNGTTCRDILATFPIPMDWPEQTVKVVDQTSTRELNAGHRAICPAVRARSF